MRARAGAPGEIEEQQAVPPGDPVLGLGVRIGGMRIDGDDRSSLHETLLRHALAGELPQLALGGRLAGPEAPGGFLRRRLLRLRDQLGGDGLRGQLLSREHASDLRHQVGAGHHLRAHRADQLDRARVDARHRGYFVPRRVLHGDAPGPAQDAPQLAVAHPPRRVGGGLPRHSVERVRLDGMHQLLRLSTREHQAVPAPAADPARVQAQDAVGDRIRAAEIVEEPAVQLLLLQRGLDTGELLGGQAGRPSGGRGGSRVRGRGRLCDHGGEEQRDHFSFPPDPANPSSRSRNSTLKVVRDP